jgi:3-phenylpropionate/trans-cinnamate dioxygenase ferredoxin component
MKFVKAARKDELPTGAKQLVTLEGQTLLLANIAGEILAIDNRCPHMGGSLIDGEIEGDTIVCPKHKTTFSLRTGKVIRNGHIVFIPLKVNDVKTYPTQLKGNDIMVGIG